MKKTISYFVLKLCFLLFFFHIEAISFANQNKSIDNFYIIPLEFINNTPYINTIIENKKVKLILDTGAGTAIYLRKGILKDLKKIKFTGQYDQSVDAGGRIQKMPFFVLENIQAADYSVNKVAGIEYKPWGIQISDGNSQATNNSARKNIEDGIIGLKFFQKNNVIIDYPKKRLIVLKPGTIHPDYSKTNWKSSRLSTSDNILTLEARLEGRPYTFLIDTGSTGSILKKTLLADMNKRDVNKILLNSFVISGKNYGPIDFFTYDLFGAQFDGLLGHDFFSQNVIFLDFQNKVFKIS